MKILFILKQQGYLRHFDSVVSSLVNRGHSVCLAPQDGVFKLPSSLKSHSRISFAACPKKRTDGWNDHASLLRRASDYLRYLTPVYEKSGKLRARAFNKLIHSFSNGVRDVEAGWAEFGWNFSQDERNKLKRLFDQVEHNIPPDLGFKEFLTSESPDVVLITPLIDLGSGQTDIVKAAQSLGIPVGMLLFSWDNLSTKGSIHVLPDRVFVWNDLQKREARELHNVPASHIHVTGAARFDRFYAMKPATHRNEFYKLLGFNQSFPLITYLCSSKFVAEEEFSFIKMWLDNIRHSSDKLTKNANVLVKSHPDIKTTWHATNQQRVQWDKIGRVMLSSPFEDESVKVVGTSFSGHQLLYDSLHHSAVAVGLNTSAEIEAGILGTPVYTIHGSGLLAEGQSDTLHFHYLLKKNGGFVEEASSFDEHNAQLTTALAGKIDLKQIQQRTADFVRPKGINTPATKLLVRGIEKRLVLKSLKKSQSSLSSSSSEQPVAIDYVPHKIMIRATSAPEQRWRRRPCSKEPWTVKWIEKYVQEGDVFYDIGANVGAFSLIAAKHCKGKLTIVAFEPGYASFAHLCDNIILNDCREVILPVPLPLWSKTSLVKFKYRSVQAGESRHGISEISETMNNGSKTVQSQSLNKYTQTVCAVKLDELIKSYGLPLPTHVKLDVDQSELHVLKGASTVLEYKGLRTLLVEMDQGLETKIFDLLGSYGLSLVERYGRDNKPNAPSYGLFSR